MKNKKYILAKRPNGFPDEKTWNLEEEDVRDPSDKEVVIEHYYISLDPAMRGWINEGKSYIEPVALGAVMRAGTIGKVIKAGTDSKYKVGDCLTGMGGVQLYCTTTADNWHKVDDTLAPMTKYLSVLGMTGMTAYFGITEIGKIKEGETVLVSAATGAVGSIVGQIAKIKGCKVIGIAGGKEKCDYLISELGFDAAVDYKDGNFPRILRKTCAEGIDVYFDNVGGDILDMALTLLKKHARVVICGAISQYNNEGKIKGPNNYMSLLVNRARMEGMVVFDFADRYGMASKDLSKWLQEGKLISQEDVYNGIDNFYDTFKRLFSGNKQGKLLLKVKE